MKQEKEVVLEVQDLCKIYEPSWFARTFRKHESFVAVNKISFSLQKGEILGFLGPNGAGKTTTMQMLLGTLTPTSGDIRYFGSSFYDNRSGLLKHVGYASTYVSLPHRLTINENLEVFGRLYDIPHKKRKARIAEILQRFALWDMRYREVGTLSAGQMSRVMFAKAFLIEPKIALLDEPTAALDPDIAQEVRHFIMEQVKQYGTSILFASHNMYEVTEMCDRVIVLQNGVIIGSDTPENLANRLTTSYVWLLAGNNTDRLIRYCQDHHLTYSLEGHYVEILIEEKKISALLIGLAAAGISYTQISIKNPTLEDYFIQVARSSGDQT